MGGVDFTAVLAAAVLHLILGVIWYSDFVFGLRWRRLVTGPSHPHPGEQWAVAIVCSVAVAYALATCVAWTMASQLADGFKLGMVIGAGVVGAGYFPIYVFRNVERELFLIEAGYLLVGIVVMTCTLTVWKFSA